METEPGLACEALLKLPAGSTEKSRLIRHYAMRFAEENPDEALAWAASLGSEVEIAAANSQIALALAETDPHRAANLLSETGIAGREFDVAVVQVVQRWAARSPPDTSAWVGSFPPGPARETGIKIIADRWLQADAQGAFSWLATLQDAGVRKEAALGLEGPSSNNPWTSATHGSNTRMTASGANSNNNTNGPSRRWATTLHHLKHESYVQLPQGAPVNHNLKD